MPLKPSIETKQNIDIFSKVVCSRAPITLPGFFKAILVALIANLFIGLPAHAEFSFALIGDTPYDLGIDKKNKAFDSMVQQINDDKSIQWIIHAGDIKSGTSKCSDEMYNDRKKRFAKFNKPFILTPGDNEWTDCHRATAGSYNPIERLEKLRSVFFFQGTEFLDPVSQWAISQSQQSDTFKTYTENMMWLTEGVIFSTIHIVGSKNGEGRFSIFSKIKRTKDHDEEVNDRTQAGLNWLKTAFDTAKKEKAKAVFITIHADPGLSDNAKKKDRKPFKDFIVTLFTLTKEFGLPVVLAHGDSHKFKIDKASFGKSNPPQNFTRIVTFGAKKKSWIKVSVDSSSSEVFEFIPVKN